MNIIRNNKARKAFTMVEVVFVIVILGIVSAIGSTIIAQLYENYMMQRALHRVSSKTEIAINQIVNRLSYRIPSSTIARNPVSGNFKPVSNHKYNIVNKEDVILEWIGYDNDSFAGFTTPGWSGYSDRNSTTLGTLVSPHSNTANIATTLTGLSPTGTAPLAVIFSLGRTNATNGSNCYGYNTNTSCIYPVNGTLNFSPTLTSPVKLSSKYKLAWSAYAIVPINANNEDGRTGNVVNVSDTALNGEQQTRDFDLELRYAYQPWAGIQYDATAAQRSILIRNVTAFKFLEQGGTMRVKLCATEKVGDAGSSVNVSACKEKVVLR